MKRVPTIITLSAVFGLLLVTAGSALAQQVSMNTPTDLPDAKPGECYAQVYAPPQYETATKRVLKKDASSRIEVIPAQYETVTERVLIKEESERLEVIPATYENVTERVMVKEAGSRLETVPAVYETVTERIMVKPAQQVWKSSKGRIYGGAITDAQGNPVTKVNNAGEVLCLVEEPAEYRTVTKRVLKTPASTREVTIPAEYATVTRRVMKTPPSTRKVTIPSEYKTITNRVMKMAPSTRTIEIPAEYEAVTERKVVSEAKAQWVRVLCDVNVTSAKLREIQGALQKVGHYGGPIDGIYGTQTASAIASFQRTKGLAQGHGLTLQTLEALNVRY